MNAVLRLLTTARKVNVRRVLWGVMVLPALALGSVACGGLPTSGAATSSTTTGSTTTLAPSAAASGTAAPKGTVSAQAAVVEWVTDILQKHYVKACEFDLELPGTNIVTWCKSPAVTGSLADLHDAWAKPGIMLPPKGKVQVTGIVTSGTTATVHDTTITADGHTLYSLMHMAAPEQPGMKLTLQQQGGRWYIAEMDQDSGQASPTS